MHSSTEVISSLGSCSCHLFASFRLAVYGEGGEKIFSLPGLWILLCKFNLVRCHRIACRIENEKARTCRAQIYGADVGLLGRVGHGYRSIHVMAMQDRGLECGKVYEGENGSRAVEVRRKEETGMDADLHVHQGIRGRGRIRAVAL